MAVAYATIASIKALGVIPNAEVDAFEAKYPGRIVEISLAESDDADSMMRPRYGVPFPLPAPPVVVKHVAAIVVWKMYLVKGINPSATQLVEIARCYRVDIAFHCREAAKIRYAPADTDDDGPPF